MAHTINLTIHENHHITLPHYPEIVAHKSTCSAFCNAIKRDSLSLRGKEIAILCSTQELMDSNYFL